MCLVWSKLNVLIEAGKGLELIVSVGVVARFGSEEFPLLDLVGRPSEIHFSTGIFVAWVLISSSEVSRLFCRHFCNKSSISSNSDCFILRVRRSFARFINRKQFVKKSCFFC